jgi:ribosome maturation factor RimP
MIELKEIQQVTKDIIRTKPFADKKTFLVDISISPNNNINIWLDAFEGISVDDCTAVNKAFKQHFDQDIENYELTVSSAGLTNPFKVKEQYQKAIGTEIKIQKTDGKRVRGKLTEVKDTEISIEFFKKKQKETIKETIDFEAIKSAKPILSF